MGHGDLMIVCDAGFPIPSSAWRIDLAIAPDVPDLETVLTPIAENFIAEKVSYADTLPVHNAPLLEKVERLFAGAELAPVKHETILGEMAAKAKVIVRTGAFDPWGNILLYSGVDVPKWFSKPGVVAPDYYAKKTEGLMPRIFDFGGREVERSQTVAGLRALKGTGSHATQVTAETADEAAAAEAAGIEMVVCRAANVARVREGSKKAVRHRRARLCRGGHRRRDPAARPSARSRPAPTRCITGRGYDTVRMLADEQIPVMGHLGFVPRKSTWVGGVRAVGKTAAEALDLWDRFRRLEDAGAFAVECELIAAAGHGRDQPAHGPGHRLAGLGPGCRRHLPVHLRHLRRGCAIAAACPRLGRLGAPAPGRQGRAGSGAFRFPISGRYRRFSRRVGDSQDRCRMSWKHFVKALDG